MASAERIQRQGFYSFRSCTSERTCLRSWASGIVSKMPREIEIRNKAEKDLRGISKRDGERIAKAIMGLRSDLAGDVKRLTNFTPEYRLRVGDWRVLFEVESDRIVI